MNSAGVERRDSTRSPGARDDAAIYAQHADELIRFATMLVGPSGAEDVVADAIVRVFSSPGWRDVASPRAYLFRSVLRQAQSARRSAQRRLAREIRTAERDATNSVTPLTPDLLRAMKALTVRQRAVVFMTHWLDESTEDIARALHVTARSVQRDLASAHRRMEEHLR